MIYYTIDPRLREGLESWLFSKDNADGSRRHAIELVDVVNRICDNLDLLTSMPDNITGVLSEYRGIQNVEENSLSTVSLNRLLFEMHYREYLK